MSLVPYLHRVTAGVDLTSAEAHEAMTLLLEGGAHDAAVGAFLVALRVKGETAIELAGFARAMREHMEANYQHLTEAPEPVTELPEGAG